MTRGAFVELLDDVQKRCSAEEAAAYYAENIDSNVDFMGLLRILENFQAMIAHAYTYSDEYSYECITMIADAYNDAIGEAKEHGELLDD